MWLTKINTIFSKVILLYSSIVFATLLLVSLIILTGLHYSMKTSTEEDLKHSAAETLAYLNDAQTVDTTIFIRANIPMYVTLQIYNSAGNLILDNGPAYAVKNHSDRTIDEAIRTNTALPIAMQGDTEAGYAYYTRWTSPAGAVYYLRFFHHPGKENIFLTLLTGELAFIMLGSLILTIVLGMYVMRKSMAPLQHISATMNDMEVTNLGNRITLSNHKNEVHDVAVSINQALDRIEYGYKRQQQFVSDASHELRTPITVIAGYADLLDRWGKNDPAITDESLAAIKSETNYMKDLIERLLFFARNNNGTLSQHFTLFDTAPLLQELYAEMTLIDKDHQICLGTNDSVMLYAEPGSIKQMLRVFVDNALKYTPKGGSITLSCKATATKVAYTVADTGIGIPKADQARVFERFYRVDSSRTKETGGSGLGLSIAKRIAKANHADIMMHSEEYVGTTITVTFPLPTETEDID